MVKYCTLILCFSCIFQFAYSQELNLKGPTKIQAIVGKEIAVELNVVGIKKYTIRLEGGPRTATIQNSKFIWIPRPGDDKSYNVKFYLLDSAGIMVSEADMDLTVDTPADVPTIVFDRSLEDTIKIIEGELFFVSGTIKSGNDSDPKATATYFLFNENADIRSLDSCRVTRMGDQILFGWTPSNREAVQGYAKFRITLVNSDNLVGSRVLNFKIKNVNQKPKFVKEIPDTLFIASDGDLVLDISAVDPDHDNLRYDFSPKSPHFYLQGSKLVFKPDVHGNEPDEFPVRLLVSVSDGEYSIKRSVFVQRNKLIQQPSIGDFTRDEFYEGDSLITYLNISNDYDLKQSEIKLSDLALPPGIGSLSNRLSFERSLSYIKVKSKGKLPYYLVDRDYTYNIAVTLSGKTEKLKPVFKVLTLTIKDRPDPTSVGHQKDSLIDNINRYLKVEDIYKANLERLYTTINRPWWKKVAVITGTLSGVLSIVQSQDPNKEVSVVAAVVSLVSITVTNLPSLKEKTLSNLNDKISNSKGRVEQIQERESDFRSNWSLDIDRSSFDKMKADLLERINRSDIKRKEDVCSLLADKTLRRKIEKLIRTKGATNSKFELKSIFTCQQKP